MMLLNTYLQERFKDWTDDMLHDRMREIRMLGGDDNEAAMIQAESKRRQEEWEAKQLEKSSREVLRSFGFEEQVLEQWTDAECDEQLEAIEMYPDD